MYNHTNAPGRIYWKITNNIAAIVSLVHYYFKPENLHLLLTMNPIKFYAIIAIYFLLPTLWICVSTLQHFAPNYIKVPDQNQLHLAKQ